MPRAGGPDPDVIKALERAGLASEGCVPLFHATSCEAARSIEGERSLKAPSGCGQVWLASSREIAVLHGSAGADPSQEAALRVVEVVVEVTVHVEDLFYERDQRGEEGDMQIFYVYDEGQGCPIGDCTVHPGR